MKPFGLSQMKILEEMTPDEIAPIQRFCEEVFYPFDTVLAYDGEDAKYVFLLRQGRTERAVGATALGFSLMRSTGIRDTAESATVTPSVAA